MEQSITKQKIVECLKTEGRSPQTKIQGITKINYYFLLKVLQELEQENLIIKTKEGKKTLWELKGGEINANAN